MAQLSLLDGQPALLFEELLLALQRACVSVAKVDRFGSELDQHERRGQSAGRDRNPCAARNGSSLTARLGSEQILAGGNGRNVARSAMARERPESRTLAPRRRRGS